MESVQEDVEESATSGRLSVVLGRQLLEVEGVSFLPAVHLCEAGAIPQDELCGELLYWNYKYILIHISPVNCPVGTHFNVVTKECRPCTAGSYQVPWMILVAFSSL